MNDSGEYLCLAENSAGKAVKSILLTVQVTTVVIMPPPRQHHPVQDVPGVVPDLAILDYTSRLANLSWTPPYDGESAITSYNIHYKPYTGNEAPHLNPQNWLQPANLGWLGKCPCIACSNHENQTL